MKKYTVQFSRVYEVTEQEVINRLDATKEVGEFPNGYSDATKSEVAVEIAFEVIHEEVDYFTENMDDFVSANVTEREMTEEEIFDYAN